MRFLDRKIIKNSNSIIKRWIGFAIISLITLVLIKFTILYPLSLAKFNVAQNIFEQYNLIDAYFTIYNNNKPKKNKETKEDATVSIWPDNQIFIINVAGCTSRDSIAKYLEMIGSVSPKVIGIDAFFDNLDNKTDTSLIRVLSETTNAIVVNYLQKKDEDPQKWNVFYELKEPVIDYKLTLHSGYSNLVNDKGLTSTCRYFAPYMFLDKDTVWSFTSEIAKVAMNDEYQQLLQRKKGKEYINFTVNDFDTIAIRSLLNKDTLELLANNIVLIGNLDDYKDKHVTPIHPQMSGVTIQAHILSTIRDNAYINSMPESWAWIMAFFIIMFTAWLKHRIAKKKWISLIMPVFQVIILLIGISLCYLICMRCNYYIPVIYTLIGVGIVGFPYSLYYEIAKVIQKHKKIKQ